ncbi:MAG: carbohydrate ABC transporter permease [Chloroflexi bacterium]|nr:carbohydrate ABC transporter permease [Chloroflexota bacterium]MCC6896859.1 carbohydrate ABC transporter permease [Anaerolineae bacterium]
MYANTTFRNWQILKNITIYAVLIVLAAVFLFPLVWSFLNSVKTPPEALAVPPTYLPTRIVLDNYAELTTYGRGGIVRRITNSAFVAVVTVVGTLVLSTLGGYGFARFKFKGKNVLFVLVLSTLMIPFQSILIPLFVMLSAVDLHNNLFGLALVYITFQLPFGIFLMRNSFMTVPQEIEESALLDGCTSVSVLYKMLLRLVLPGIITVAIYAFINSWNEFLAALIFMTDQDNFTLPIFLSNVRSGLYGQIDWGALQAGVTVSIIPSVLIFLLLQRYYMNGLMGGAVKS